MDILYEILGCIILILIFVLGCVFQETIIKRYFPRLYSKLVYDDEES